MTEPIVRGVDHVYVPLSDAEAAYSVLTATLGLPIAWPYTAYGDFASGGVNLGSLNLEVPGALVGITLLAILAGVFDPPADVPVMPFAAIGAVGLAVIVGLATAVIIAGVVSSRIDVIAALRER